MYLLRRILTLCILPVALFATACGSDNNGPTAPTTPPPQGPAELQKIDITVGTGDEAINNKIVTVQYILWRYDPAGTDSKGEALEQGTVSPFRLGTNAVIAGFEQGVLGMKVQGVRRIIVPPSLAYGSAGRAPSIRPNEWLVFELGLAQVQ